MFEKLQSKCLREKEEREVTDLVESGKQLLFPLFSMAVSFLIAKRFKEGLDEAAVESTMNGDPSDLAQELERINLSEI